MPDIFLSYNRNDQAIARQFAERFEREGFSVWWDQTLRSGEAYDKVTEKALEEARAVVVLWSKASVDSRWVRAEATQADRNGTLVPVMIEPCKRPIMFELTHTAELGKWKGDPGDPAWQAFVADVRQFVLKDPSVAPAARPVLVPKRTFSTLKIAIAVAALAIASGAAWWVLNGASGAPGFGTSTTAATTKGAVTLAVVPFANPDGSEEGRVLAFGIAESVQHQLANLNDLSVISWSSASGIGNDSQDIREIASTLGVAYVVQGSVQRQGDVLRVTARLVETATERNIWSLRLLPGQQKDVFSIQDEIALQVTRALSVSVSPDGQARLRGQGTQNVEAYLAFLEGQDALSTWRTEEAGVAAAHFNKALQLDPQFARAMVMLARARLRDAEYSASQDIRTQVQQSRSEAATLIARALALDPQLSDGYVERGDLLVFENPQAAEQDYRKAIELSPSSARAHQQLASLLWEDPRRRNETVELLERARALDPLESGLDVALAVYLYFEAGKIEEADLLLRRVLERQPDYVPALQRHGEVLMFGMGRAVDAIKAYEKALAIDAGTETARRALVRAYVSIGAIKTAQRIAEDPQASLVCRLVVAHAQRHVAEAGRLASAAFRDDLVTGGDQQLAVESIILDAHRSKDYARAATELEEALNIVWVSETEPVLGLNRGTAGDVVAYAGMLRAAGDESRAQALLRVVEMTLDEDEAQRGSINIWNTVARVRLSAMKGDKEETLSMLEQTCTSGKFECWESLETDPLLAPLRGEARYKELVRQIRRRQEEARKVLKAA